jgi:hypothetical protein
MSAVLSASPVDSDPSLTCTRGDCPRCDDRLTADRRAGVEGYLTDEPSEADRRWWSRQNPDASGLTEREAERLDFRLDTVPALDFLLDSIPDAEWDRMAAERQAEDI